MAVEFEFHAILVDFEDGDTIDDVADTDDSSVDDRGRVVLGVHDPAQFYEFRVIYGGRLVWFLNRCRIVLDQEL